MQNQPQDPFIPGQLPLPDDFPIRLGDRISLGDADITALHAHPHFEFGYCHEGSGIVAAERRIFPFSAGDVTVFAPDEMHYSRSAKGTRSIWSWVSVDLGPRLVAALPEPGLLDVSFVRHHEFDNLITPSRNDRIGNVLLDLIGCLRHPGPFHKTEVLSSIWLLLVALRRTTSASVLDAADRHNTNALQRIQEAISHMTTHYPEPVRMDELTALCHLSPNHFRRLFVAAVGMSPSQYLHYLRVSMASAALLQGRESITVIAMNCGYPSISSFNRQFRKQTGMSPRNYRKSGGGAPPRIRPTARLRLPS
jgi:AraC-like DNA-binding protein